MSKNNKVSIFILIDALGWDYIKNKSFLDDVAETRTNLKTILGYSSAAVPSILSGKYPNEHGHWSYFYYSPETSPFKWMKPISRLPEVISERLRTYIKKKTVKKSGYNGYFQIYAVPLKYLHFFDYCEKKDMWRQNGLNNAKSIFDYLYINNIDYFLSTWPTPDKISVQTALHNLEATTSTNFYFLYLTEMDGLMHSHGTDSEVIDDKTEWYERQIRSIYEKANENFQEVDLYVFSDHGMTNTVKTFDLMGEIKKLHLQIPKDFIPFYDSTMARFWFNSENARRMITDLLNSLEYGKILTEKELKELGVYFENKQYGELIFLMNSGYLIVPSYMGKTAPKGMHGFHPDHKTSDGIFLSSNEIKRKLEHITDIFGVMINDVMSTQ